MTASCGRVGTSAAGNVVQTFGRGAPTLEVALVALAVAPWLGEAACVVAAVALAFALVRYPGVAVRAAAVVPVLEPVVRALGVAAVAAVAAAAAGPLGLRLGALGRLVPQLALPLVAVAGYAAGPRARRRACRAFVWTGVATSLLGLSWWAVGWSPASALPALAAANGQSFVPGSTRPVAAGLSMHRLVHAHLLLLATAVPLVGRGGGRGRAWDRLGAATLWLALAATYARTAALAAAVGVVMRVAAAMRRRTVGGLLAAGLAAGTATWWASGAPAPGDAVGWVGGTLLGRGGERQEIWRAAIDICCAYPFGVGLGNYPQVAAATYACAAPLSAAPHTAPHGWWLGALAEGGPVQLAATLAAWSLAAATGLSAVRHGRSRARRRAGGVLVQLCAVVAVVGVGHDVLHHARVAWAVWAALGLAFAACVGPASPRGSAHVDFLRTVRP